MVERFRSWFGDPTSGLRFRAFWSFPHNSRDVRFLSPGPSTNGGSVVGHDPLNWIPPEGRHAPSHPEPIDAGFNTCHPITATGNDPTQQTRSTESRVANSYRDSFPWFTFRPFLKLFAKQPLHFALGASKPQLLPDQYLTGWRKKRSVPTCSVMIVFPQQHHPEGPRYGLVR